MRSLQSYVLQLEKPDEKQLFLFLTNRNPYCHNPKFAFLGMWFRTKGRFCLRSLALLFGSSVVCLTVHSCFTSANPRPDSSWPVGISGQHCQIPPVFLANLHSRKERVRRLLSQPSGYTCSVDIHNMKHMCFAQKNVLKKGSKGYRGDCQRKRHPSSMQEFPDKTNLADLLQVRPALWFIRTRLSGF